MQKGYSNSDDCPCVFIKRFSSRFCIISMYVDDINIIGNLQNIDEARNHLMMEFEMKIWVKPNFALDCKLSTFIQEF